MVLDVAVEAVWRMAEGLVGGGVFLVREGRMDRGFGNEMDDLVSGFWVGRGAAGFWRERAAAADLDVRVDGPLETGFLAWRFCGFGLVDKAAMLFWYFSSAARLFSMLTEHSISVHSGSCIQGMLVLSRSLRSLASVFLSAISFSFNRRRSCRSQKLRPSSPTLVTK